MTYPFSIHAALERATGLIPPVADIHYATQAEYDQHIVTTVTYASSDWWPDSPAGDAAPIMVQASIVENLVTGEVDVPHQEVW